MDCFRPSRSERPMPPRMVFFCHAKHGTGLRADTGDQVIDGLLELRFGDEASDEAEFEGALGGDGFARQNNLERGFGADKKRQDGRREWRKNANGNLGLGETGFGSGDYEIAESSQFGSAADCGAVDHADDGLAGFEHSGESGVEGVEHLKDALRCVFTDIDPTAKNLAGGVENDELDLFAFAGEGNSLGDFTQHGFVEEIVIRAAESYARDSGIEAELNEFKLVRAAFARLRNEFRSIHWLDHARPPGIDGCPRLRIRVQKRLKNGRIRC